MVYIYEDAITKKVYLRMKEFDDQDKLLGTIHMGDLVEFVERETL